jgi:hypothetical protein
MTRSADFGPGLGLDVHARTSIVDTWSLISNAAVRIGDDIFEVVNDGTHYLNGKQNVDFPLMMAGKYIVTKSVDVFKSVGENGDETASDQEHYTIELGNSQKITISNYRSMISVQVNAFFSDAEGMLGIHGKEGLIGRDRETVLENPNDMGAHWQINDQERMLFKEARAPQYPKTCILPSVTSRRLRQSPERRRLAEVACSGVTGAMFDFCIEDVSLTGDVLLANAYGLAW